MARIRSFVIVAMLFVVLPTSAEARIGKLDRDFGKGGKVIMPPHALGGLYPAVGPDGSIVVISLYQRRVLRFLPNGSLDRQFGTGGWVGFPAMDGQPLGFYDAAIDSHGRVLLFGAVDDISHQYTPPNWMSISEHFGLVVRLTPGGEIDPTFGEGKGYVRSDFGLPSKLETDLPMAVIVDGTVDSVDRPVFVVETDAEVFHCYGLGGWTISSIPAGVVRLLPSGAADPTFAGDGVVPLATEGDGEGIALDSLGRPLVAVGSGPCKGGQRVFRFEANGEPLRTFGVDGVYENPQLDFAAFANSEATIFRDARRPTRGLFRLNGDGSLDKTFGERGKVTVRRLPGARRTLWPVGIDQGGGLILAGSNAKAHAKGEKWKTPRRNSFLVTRLLPSGKTDLAFGKRGWITTPLPPAPEAEAIWAALDPQGRLVLIGESSPNGVQNRLVLTRYLLGHQPKSAF